MKWMIGCLSLLISLAGCSHRSLKMLPPGLNGPQPEIDERFAMVLSEERVALTKAYFKEHNYKHYSRIKDLSGLAALQITPKVLVVHYTAIPSLEATAAYFKPNRIASDRGKVADAGALNVGIQFMVDLDGRIYRHYPETAASRHVIGLNHVAIGIENIGDADLGSEEPGRVGLTQAQVLANAALIRYLAGKYPSLKLVIAHSEYRLMEKPGSPLKGLFHEDLPKYRTTKSDPGPRFMAALRAELNKSVPAKTAD